MAELKVTSERVLSAAEKCADAKKVLQELFPEVFKPVCPVDFSTVEGELLLKDAKGNIIPGRIARRTIGLYKGKGIYLPTQGAWEWTVVKDEHNLAILTLVEGK